MPKYFILILSVLFVSTLSAQKPEATLKKASVAPVIGDIIDTVWNEADENAILLPFKNETPTLGSDGDTWWKGLWTYDGIYLLANITDNDYYPYYAAPGGSSFNMYDQVEWYFDCNYVKEDGIGASPEGNAGHYQIAPAVPKGGDDGTLFEDFQPGNGIQYAYNATDAPNWWQEIFIPFEWLKDQDGIMLDLGADIGFDVTVVDADRPNDNARQRAVWANDGKDYGMDESLNNMDGAGFIYFDGVQVIYPEEIILTGVDITVDNEPMLIGVDSYLENPREGLIWIINDEETTAIVRVSEEGLVTPISNGVLKIKATSSDGFVESNEITINISNQHVTIQEVSWLIDGFNDIPNEDYSPNNAWARVDGLNGHTAYIEEGVFHFSSDSVLSSASSMKIRQMVDLPIKYAEEEFLIVFKMWAEEVTSFQLVLEDRNNNWAHWGISTGANTPNAVPNKGNTRWDLTVATEPKWFRMHFIPSNIKENSILDFSFQPGLTGVEIQMDSLYLIAVKDSAIIDWDYPCCLDDVVQNREVETLNVYPNPAKDVLNVMLEKGNTKVSIYSSLGIKMEEILVEGTHHVFDISNYSPGLYFVKANNSVKKVIK